MANSKSETVIWRDVVDKDVFMLGVYVPARTIVGQSYSAFTSGWVALHIDCISDLFGDDVHEAAKKLVPGTSHRIYFNASMTNCH